KSAALDETALAGQARLYLDTRQLNSLAAGDFEVGNHTYSHVHCRNLSLKEIEREIGGNKTALETASGRTIPSLSQLYGSSRDVTPQLAQYLQSTGHHSAFLSESVANFRGSDRFLIDRVNPCVDGEDSLFFDLEVLPRARAMRNGIFRAVHA